jgi:eukaryotic-like serine/threonine-protein kinase
MSTARPLVRPTRLRPDTNATPRSGYGLSPRLTKRARERLGQLAIGIAVTAALGSVMATTLQTVMGTSFEVAVWVGVFNLGGAAVGVGLWRLTKSPRITDSRVLDLGLVWHVTGCLAFNLHFLWFFPAIKGFVPPVSPVVLWIVLQPVVVPTPTRRAVIAAVAAALSAPFCLVLLIATDNVDAPMTQVVDVAMMPLIAAGLAIYASRVVHQLAVDAATAERMGSYQLEERLGEGGMGEVWRATHGMLARPAAVKLIRADMLSSGGSEGADAAVARFEQEARSTAALRSPHTVEVFDFGRADDGRIYYVMELLDGIDLQSLLREFGPQPPARVVSILKQVCHSLDEAHAAGLVHRDIKPANLFLCRYGRDHDFVKVLDFGLVRSNDGGGVDSQITQAGTPMGTPAYMSPEMVSGDEVDGRADLYAVGCVAYQLLTGEPPFEGKNPVATLLLHASQPASPPSLKAPQPVPASLDALVLDCLEKDPAQRIGSASELGQRLAALQLEEVWTGTDAAAWWTAHGGGVAAEGDGPSEGAFDPTMPVPGLSDP